MQRTTTVRSPRAAPATEGHSKVDARLVARHELALQILMNRELANLDKAVFGALLAHYNNRLREAWPSQKTIMKLTGASKRSVQKAIERLVELGLVRIVRQGGGAGRPTIYAFPDVDEAIESDSVPT